MSATSCAMTTSMWSLFGQLTYIPTAFHFHIIPPPIPSTQYFQPEEKFERQRRGMGLQNMLTQANERGGMRGRNTKRHARRKRLCRAVEEIQQLPQQFSTGVWKELVYFPHQEHVRSHDHRATFSRSLWELAASKTLEGQGFSPRKVFQMCCINMTNVFSTLNVTQTTILFRLFP